MKNLEDLGGWYLRIGINNLRGSTGTWKIQAWPSQWFLSGTESYRIFDDPLSRSVGRSFALHRKPSEGPQTQTNASFDMVIVSTQESADLANKRRRQLTTARANRTTGLTNVRAANWVPEVEFSPFRMLTCRQMTFPSCCFFFIWICTAGCEMQENNHRDNGFVSGWLDWRTLLGRSLLPF